MGKFYIYNTNIEDKKYKNITTIFNPDTEFDFNSLKKELTEYFRNYPQTSALVFMHCTKTKNVQQIITNNIETIFKSIPKVEENFLRENIFYIIYDEKSLTFNNNKFLKKYKAEIINQGLTKIFISNGGLVESNGIAHHFVFPSGKHSSKFLRTANVLVYKSEIDFISINTLHLFKNLDFENIYCDTLSINVIGYSMKKYITRFNKNKEINIESFKSYNGLYDKKSIFYDNSIFLISASTSGGLIYYIQKNHPEIKSEEICTLFYLPINNNSTIILERVLCNLERNEKLNYGIELFSQFKPNERCIYCENHSTPIRIIGDSFSLDEPIINTRNIIAPKYITKSLKDFVQVFKYNKKVGTSLKVSYSEESVSRKRYNLYIDYEKIINNINEENFKKHKNKIDAYINQFIPASTKYIIHLNDLGSLKLSNYIYEQIKSYSKNNIEIINQSNLIDKNISKNETGAILIVGSCITNGKNLLYLSRFFRNYENVRLIYFIGINRISDSKKNNELKSNVKYGLYGSENSSFVEIETINCDNSNLETPWEIEIDYWKEIREHLDKVPVFIEERINTINTFSNNKNKGGTNKIFFSDINEKELEIRKNSAFFNDNNYFDNVSQSDVYFTISCVLNKMRNNKKDGLYQTNFVKNLLDPFVFNRFNDGIIQASILRAAKEEELNYSFSYENSNDMLMLLKTFIKHIREYQGEAIYEFLYALAIGKLRLYKKHYEIIINDLREIKDNKINIFRDSIVKIHKDFL